MDVFEQSTKNISAKTLYILWHIDLLLVATAMKQATIQQPLPSNNSTEKHVSMAIREHSNNGRATWSMPRCYN
jgi:hypothetical protein